jgi:hypothetical protein
LTRSFQSQILTGEGKFMTDDSNIKNLGPLAPLAGIWEGEKGDDVSPDDDRKVETNKFRERLVLEPIGRVDNHEQILYGLKYSTVAWRIGEPDPFHQEVGYWLWDSASHQVMRCFIVPRGVNVLAGGTVPPDARQFQLAAEVGSPTYGISSNLFLDKEFRTVRYELKITVHSNDSFSYEEDTQMQMKGRKELFHHTDKNTLRRVAN